MGRKLPWPEIVVTAFVIAAGAGVYLYAHKDEAALEESKRRGAELVEALHAYRSEHGTYPAELEALAPGYVPTIEQPTWGLERWRYRMYSPSGAGVRPDEATGDTAAAAGVAAPPPDRLYFQLSVAADESGYPVLYYDLEAQRWVLNN
jgi:hypothetical protein